MGEPLLAVNNLVRHFPVVKGVVLMRQVGLVKAVDGVSFSIPRGTTFGLVGESGCGKTTVANLILRLEKTTSGSILFEGYDISRWRGHDLSRYQRSVQAVFQDPYGSLSPRMRVSEIVAEPVIVHGHLSRREQRSLVVRLLETVGLNARHMDMYPHEFSGGQCQRIAIARALALQPKLIVLDEPISALDVSIRAQIMNLLGQLQKESGLTYLLIAHDLAVIKHMSANIGVMYLGKLVETARSEELYRNSLHPYTQALFSATLPSHPDIRGQRIILPGDVPSPLNPPSGCRFHPRCKLVMPVCSNVEPPLQEVAIGHQVACHLYEGLAAGQVAAIEDNEAASGELLDVRIRC